MSILPSGTMDLMQAICSPRQGTDLTHFIGVPSHFPLWISPKVAELFGKPHLFIGTPILGCLLFHSDSIYRFHRVCVEARNQPPLAG